jgi:hypothetical protein
MTGTDGSQQWITPNGNWEVQPDGSVKWIPEDAFDSADAFTGFEDSKPPERTAEEFVNSGAATDGFTPDNSGNWVFRHFNRKLMAWPSDRMPLRVYISGTIQKARNGMVAGLITECLQQWCRVVNHNVSFVVTSDFRNADIYFLQRDPEGHVFAESTRHYTKKGLDTVQINVHEQTVKYLAERRLRAVLLHEAGHAMGLIDHSDNPNDVMSCYGCGVNASLKALSENDKNALRNIYAGQLATNSTARVLTYQWLSQASAKVFDASRTIRMDELPLPAGHTDLKSSRQN